MRGGVDGWMCFIVVFSFPGCTKAALFERLSESSPCEVYSLFMNKAHEVELRVELIRFSTRVG